VCGIGGKRSFDRARPVEYPVLERMKAAQAHRGTRENPGTIRHGTLGNTLVSLYQELTG
jgi:hypothetical protein